MCPIRLLLVVSLSFCCNALAQNPGELEKKALANPAVPQWIWSTPKAKDREVVFLRKTFAIGQTPSSAKLMATCDNDVTIYVNGVEVARSDNWQQPVQVDILKHLVHGDNLFAAKCTNAGGAAAFIARLDWTVVHRKMPALVTDASWQWSAKEEANWTNVAPPAGEWRPVHVIGKVGIGPWNDVFDKGGAPVGEALSGDKLTVLPGFRAERLYSVPKGEQGSWVSMTFDARGRIIACDQGGGLYRITVGSTESDTRVDLLDTPIKGAQGLLWAFDSLYATVNGGKVKLADGATGNGLYRLRDTNGDDQFDEVKQITKFDGGGEHGPHGVVLSPDGKRLYLVAGNFTKPPQPLSPASPHRNWAEDLLLVRAPDGGGHDPHVMAPGGWVASVAPDGGDWTLVAAGLRNSYDIAFNQDGELFTYDSDMEWDVGAPWYRPTRCNHIVSGGEYGWRNGSGKWPAYYADSLPGYDIGLGSPTGVTFGTGAKFPAKYQRAFFVLDWTYGKIYAMHFTPAGASYTATFEQFVAGRPLPVTDVAIGPDGAMYFTVGGRNTQSGLFRVSYVGDEPTAPVGPVVDERAATARAKRHQLETFHGRIDPAAVATAWPYLDSSDRHLRYAARLAVEHQPVAEWQARALVEKRTTARLTALIALARAGQKEIQPQLLAALDRLDFATLSEEQQLTYLRALGLTFIRLGEPETATAAHWTGLLDPAFPAASDPVNRELVQLLVYLKSPHVVAKSMALLKRALSQEEQWHYVFVLRHLKVGWTPELRNEWFSWANLAAAKYSGGNSFKKFLANMKNDAVATLSEAEREQFKTMIAGETSVVVVSDEKPRKFVHNWQMEDLLQLLGEAETGRDFERGKAAFTATQCLRCHRFRGDGGGVGPDITGAGNRYNTRDALESILLPSKVISDQYASKTVVSTTGLTVTGLVAMGADGSASVFQSNGQTTRIPKDQIEEIVASPVSTMPEGLLSILTKDEILDLVAYLRSAGNPQDPIFAKSRAGQ